MLGREASVLSTSSSSSESRESHERSGCDECDVLSGSTVSTLVRYLAGCSINLVLPFLNGLMLGFGELVAHEVCWQYRWFYHGKGSAHKIFPTWRKEAPAAAQPAQQDGADRSKPDQGLGRRVADSWDHVRSKFL